MFWKETFSGIAIVITFIAFIPYIRSILRNEVKAHVFSWIIWGTTTFVVFLAQLEGRGGAGAWPIGISGIITISIAVLAYIKRGDLTITRTDWAFFISAMASIPIWYITTDPLWAVVILTTVDVLGFGPTIRKAYFYPESESVLFFALFVLRNFLSTSALEHYSITTVLFPSATGTACFLLIGLVLHRRAFLNKQNMEYV